MRILVTGCNGQLGRELRPLLEARWPGKNIYTDIDTLNLTDGDAVRSAVTDEDITHIINCAAYTTVDRAESEPDIASAVNDKAVDNIARAASERGVKVIHVSTDYVFDGESHTPYRESDKANPLQVYGITKRRGEKTLLAMCPDAIVIRTAWLYSPHGSNFVKTMIRLGREKKQLGVVFDQIGTPTSATDLAAAIVAVIAAPRWLPGTYHYTDEGVASWYDFTKAIHRLWGISGCNVTPLLTSEYPTAARRPAYTVLDKTLIKKTFGLTIPHWEESLARCIETLKNQEKDANGIDNN